MEDFRSGFCAALSADGAASIRAQGRARPPTESGVWIRLGSGRAQTEGPIRPTDTKYRREKNRDGKQAPPGFVVNTGPEDHEAADGTYDAVKAANIGFHFGIGGLAVSMPASPDLTTKNTKLTMPICRR